MESENQRENNHRDAGKRSMIKSGDSFMDRDKFGRMRVSYQYVHKVALSLAEVWRRTRAIFKSFLTFLNYS